MTDQLSTLVSPFPPPAYSTSPLSPLTSPLSDSRSPAPPYHATLSRTASQPYAIGPSSLPNNSSSHSLSRRFSGSVFRSSQESATFDEINPPWVDPATLLPPTFKIGNRHIPPVVSIREVKDHLLLLSAFQSVQDHVKTSALQGCLEVNSLSTEGEPNSRPMAPDVAFQIYLVWSERRFFQWMQDSKWSMTDLVLEMWTPQMLPPDLGMVMIWHAYCLNPRSE